jgi:hypothetical protein
MKHGFRIDEFLQFSTVLPGVKGVNSLMFSFFIRLVSDTVSGALLNRISAGRRSAG